METVLKWLSEAVEDTEAELSSAAWRFSPMSSTFLP